MAQRLQGLRRATQKWVLASRPVTLGASAVPVLVGTALAAEAVSLHWLLFSLALIGAILIQIGTNLTDEYTDHRSGTANKYKAPHKVIQRGLLSERVVLRGMVLCFSISIAMGLYIVSLVGWPILLVGIFSLLAGYLYSGGPFALGSRALGEIAVFFFMGPLIIMASYYVQAQELTWPLFWASFPIGLLVTAILQCNNLRDLAEDRLGGKHTLTTIFGMRSGQWIYITLLLGAYVALVINVVVGILPWQPLIMLASLPWAFLMVHRLWRASSRGHFNSVLVATARIHMAAGLLMALGIIVHVVFGA